MRQREHGDAAVPAPASAGAAYRPRTLRIAAQLEGGGHRRRLMAAMCGDAHRHGVDRPFNRGAVRRGGGEGNRRNLPAPCGIQ